MNSQLLDYITRCRVSGMTDDQIRQELVKAGWQTAEIEEGFMGAGSAPLAVPSVEDQKPKVSSPCEKKIGE
jgi:hypothetical protein